MRIAKKKICITAGILITLALAGYFLFLSPFSSNNQNTYVYIRDNDTKDSVFAKLQQAANPRQMLGLRISATLLAYGKHIHAGRYEITPRTGSLQLLLALRGRKQKPVQLVIPVVHTMNDLAGFLGNTLQADSTTWMHCFTNQPILSSLGVDSTSLPCLFIPNTYEVYWDIKPEKFMLRMRKECDAFWTAERKQLAEKAGLTPNEVFTLASVVEQESSNEKERPMIAGMYLNRLHQGMKLQADPTVKFALRNFTLRRILHEHLKVQSPYNTYLHEGLPQGPICIPSLSSINAVLHAQPHNYLYMCAKEDFSGTHNFAATYQEHLANAKRYAEALNKRGIK